MNRLIQSFFFLLSTATDRKLARMVEYLKVENQVLRQRLPKRLILKPHEKNKLLKFGKTLGSAFKDLITIVSPRTFQRWVAGKVANKKMATVGRPRTDDEIRAIVIRIAQETGFGLGKIAGQLRKLGIRLCPIMIRTILKEAGIEPGPKRGMGSWMEFVERHAATLWACDFFVKKVWTLKGMKDYFVVVFIHIGSRRVHIAGFATHPNPAWTEKQAQQVVAGWRNEIKAPTHLIRDLDSNFGAGFDAAKANAGVKGMRVGPKQPVMNAHCERVIRTIKDEVLNHLMVFGEAHLQHLLDEALDYYHHDRPHQGLGNRLVSGRAPPEIDHDVAKDTIVCRKRLGGLLKSYTRTAA